MSDRDEQPRSDLDDDVGMEKRISFRDYPSTGWVVLAALVSGLSWLVYKRTGGKRKGPSPSKDPQQTDQRSSPASSEDPRADGR